jgi:hypothetical protein
VVARHSSSGTRGTSFRTSKLGVVVPHRSLLRVLTQRSHRVHAAEVDDPCQPVWLFSGVALGNAATDAHRCSLHWKTLHSLADACFTGTLASSTYAAEGDARQDSLRVRLYLLLRSAGVCRLPHPIRQRVQCGWDDANPVHLKHHLRTHCDSSLPQQPEYDEQSTVSGKRRSGSASTLWSSSICPTTASRDDIPHAVRVTHEVAGVDGVGIMHFERRPIPRPALLMNACTVNAGASLRSMSGSALVYVGSVSRSAFRRVASTSGSVVECLRQSDTFAAACASWKRKPARMAAAARTTTASPTPGVRAHGVSKQGPLSFRSEANPIVSGRWPASN